MFEQRGATRQRDAGRKADAHAAQQCSPRGADFVRADERAAAQEHQPRRERLQFFEVVRAQQDRLAEFAHALQHAAKLHAHRRVERAVGFVEQVEVDVDRQRREDRELLLHARAVAAHTLLQRQREDLREATFASVVGLRVERLREGQELRARHLLVDGGLARQVGATAADRERIGIRVEAEHLAAAARATMESEQHAQQRRLARAVRADEAEELAVGDVEVDAVEHARLAERLADALQADERGVVHAAAPSPAMRRKLESKRMPCGERKDSGWN